MRKPSPRRPGRADRTREAVLSAFVGLVMSEGYAAVAVGDVVRKAGIGRSTFYVHFSSKEALLAESLDRPSRALAVSVRVGATAAMIAPALSHFHQQRHVNRTFFADPVRTIWSRRLATLIARELGSRPSGPRPRACVPRDLLAAVLADAQLSLVTHWLKSPGAVTADVIAELLISHARALAA